MVSLIESAQAADYPADIQLVISNRPEAAGLLKADDLGVKAICIDHRDFETRAAFEAELDWTGKLINIHPSILPKYKGLHTHKRAIEAKDEKHGCTVHWVNEGVDEGKIIAQADLNILPEDTPDTLSRRVQALEHRLYPKALATALTSH